VPKQQRELINWKSVSRILAGNETSIRKNSCPAKYIGKVEALKSMLDLWENLYVNENPSETTIKIDVRDILERLK
jgi:hypothetical protein